MGEHAEDDNAGFPVVNADEKRPAARLQVFVFAASGGKKKHHRCFMLLYKKKVIPSIKLKEERNTDRE